MSAEGIFLIGDSGDLVVLEPSPYDTEAILQEALASHPEVLAGSTTSGQGAGRLLLIKREAGVPTAEGGPQTFSLDHLFVDSQAVPVIVEVKRSTDTRIRREVVGQMLDYAANGQRYWSVAALAEQAARDADALGTSLDAMLEGLGFEGEVDAFWLKFEENLRTGRVRLVFVADRLPPELVRIIEFLNAQMRPAEVLGVELIQYRGSGAKVLVPRVVGVTQQAADAKTTLRSSGREWTLDEVIALHRDRNGDGVADGIRELADHWIAMEPAVCRISVGTGASPAMLWISGPPDKWAPIIATYPSSGYGWFQWLDWPEGDRRELLNCLNEVPGIVIPAEKISGRPPFSLGVFASAEAREKLEGVLRWALGRWHLIHGQ